MKSTLILGMIAAATFAAGCGDKGGNNTEPNNHGDGHGHTHEGTRYPLGTKTIGGYDVELTQVKELAPGKEAMYEVKASGGKHKLEDLTIRVWLGDTAGNAPFGKTKANFNSHPEHRDFDAHITPPANMLEKLTGDVKVWVEVQDKDGTNPAAFDATVHKGDDHGHERGEGHGEEGRDIHSGEHHMLGPVTIGSYQVTIDQIGEVEAGHEMAMEVKLAKAAKGARLWFGDDTGKVIGSATRAPDGATQHVHIMVPKDIQANSKLWVEMTEEDGSKNKGSFTPVMHKE
ncbi:MAG: hypothetical protein HUU29_03655 [Planctomycetaceae bacterium]|nr:hypothetical protein [Planctomycetaceae bacterium]